MKTKLIGTIGPSINNKKHIEKCISLNLNTFRINMSHCSKEKLYELCKIIKEKSKNKSVAILLDTQGPEIRTLVDESNPIELKKNDEIFVKVRDGEISEEIKSFDINYENIVNDIEEGKLILVDSGNIELEVLKKKENGLLCKVLNSGTVTNKRHVNVPGIHIQLPGLTEKDKLDIIEGIKQDVDYIAMSFVRCASDVVELKNLIKKNNGKQKVIAKIEDAQGIKNIDKIINVSDGIMVARGDLGLEIPIEDVPIKQSELIKKARLKGKLVIVATHMLESMIQNPSPTRAEVSDIATAVRDKVDAIMLSGETATGKHPFRCIELMQKVAIRQEQEEKAKEYYDPQISIKDDQVKLMKAACLLYKEINANALVIFTRHGRTAQNASWMRINGNIFCFTDNKKLFNQLSLYWGIQAFFIEKNSNIAIIDALNFLKNNSSLKINDKVIIVAETLVNDQSLQSIQYKVIC